MTGSSDSDVNYSFGNRTEREKALEMRRNRKRKGAELLLVAPLLEESPEGVL